jgi:hypothetical protein
MEGVIANKKNIQPWLIPDVIVVLKEVHDMPKHPEIVLPKLDPDRKYSAKDHIKKFMFFVRLMNVQYEDVFYRLFPYTFENKASTWYFSLAQASITSWNAFETFSLKN